MNDPLERQEVNATLVDSGKAIGKLAANEAVFRAAVAAYRASSAEAFQHALASVQIADCESVCFWLRSKECVLECIELCGIPTKPFTVEDVPRAAVIIAKLTAEPQLVEQLAAILQKRDVAAFSSLIKQLQAANWCHFICHWACMVYWRHACEVVCHPSTKPRTVQAVLADSGAAVHRLLSDTAKLNQIITGASALDCVTLGSLLGQDGDCTLICEWICSWRCLLVCGPLCSPLPTKMDTSINEILAFAKILAPLAEKPDVFAQFTDAVVSRNAQTYAALVKQYKLEPFCLQLCHWVCFAICRRFCICICPPRPLDPLFTHVGNYKITTDFAADGTTTAGSLAFSTTIPLRGILPEPSAPDATEYHFMFEQYPLGGGPVNIVAAMIPATKIGELEYREYVAGSWGPNSADYWVNNPGATVSIPQQFGPPLVVPVNKDVKPDGWIDVPRENNYSNGGVGRFSANTGNLANLDTTKLTDENFDLTVAAPPLPLKAGSSVPAAQKSVKPTFKIYFEARKVVGHASAGANNLTKIALSNTHFKYIRHLDWAGGPVTDYLVLSLDIAELIGGGCSPLETHVHGLFTAYHPYLGTCNVYIEGPGVPPPSGVSPAISALGEAISPVGGYDFDITSVSPCAYILWLKSTLRLTNGIVTLYGTFDDHIAFCKH